MERSQQVRGIDEEGVQRLALVLGQSADDLGAARAALTAYFADAGRVSTVPAAIALVEAWLRDRAIDIRRRGLLIDHQVGPVQLHKDLFSGLHLQGFIGPGLGYRHLGQETRTVTDVFDCGDGVVSTVSTTEQRSAYEIWIGAGYGPIAWALGDPYPEHTAWAVKKRQVTYASADDGTPLRRPARPGPTESGACPA